MLSIQQAVISCWPKTKVVGKLGICRQQYSEGRLQQCCSTLLLSGVQDPCETSSLP
jgi:hypothetical protein